MAYNESYGVREEVYEAAIKRKMTDNKRKTFLKNNPEVAEFYKEYEYVGSGHLPEMIGDFLSAMVEAIKTYGGLTEKQMEALKKTLQHRQARQEEYEKLEKKRLKRLAKVKIQEGRYTIIGRVMSTKWYSHAYGATLKMLVEDAQGIRYFGSVPSSHDYGDNFIEKGDRVTFDAKVEPKDVGFAVYSRPTKMINNTKEFPED